jgi:tetratricopeptide (TPR) repeat protein
VFADRTRARVRTGPWALALRETAAGLRLVEGREEPAAVAARAWLLALRSEIRMLQGRARQAISLALTAAAEAERVQELGALARAYAALDGSYQMLGEPEKAVHERMSIEIYTALGDIRARGIAEANLGVQAYADGRWVEAADLYLRAQEDCLQAGDRQHAAMTAANLGELLVSQGRYEEAEPVLRDARRVLRSAGFTPFAIFAEIQLARSALNRGEAQDALESLTRIGAEAASVDYAALVLEAGIYLAHAQAQAGAPEVGLEVLDAAVVAAGDDAALYAAAVDRARAACLVALDRLPEACEQLDRALEAARAQGLLYEELLVRRARVLLREPGAEAEEELRETDRLAQLLDLA